MSGDFVVLDSGPFSLFCLERNDTTTDKLMTYIKTRVAIGATLAVPLTVIAETARGQYASAVRRVVNSGRVITLPLDVSGSLAIGDLLHRHGLDSQHFVDASVIVSAATLDGTVTIVTGDFSDLDNLSLGDKRIKIRGVSTLDQ